VDVPPGARASASVVLWPTPETRERHVEKTGAQRVIGWSALLGGAAVAGTGVALLLDGKSRSDDAHAEYAVLSQRDRCDTIGNDCSGERDALQMRIDHSKIEKAFGYVLGAAGALGVGLGAYLLLSGEDPHKYDGPAARGPRIVPQLGPGMAGLGVVSSF
jgi:hypothetical protein